MEFTTDQRIKAGIFVVIGILIATLSILFFGDEKVSFSGTYTLKVKLKQVQGLSISSQVALSGLRIGRIVRIDFDAQSADLIAELQIDRIHQKRLTKGAVASVKTLGALGDKYIFINPGPLDGAPIEDGAFLESDGGEDFIDVIAKKSADLSSVVEVINELNRLLKNINHQDKSREIMDNVASVTKELKAISANLNEGLDKQQIKALLRDLGHVMKKIDQGQGTLGALINDPTIHQRLVSLLGESPRQNFLKPLIRQNINSRPNSNGP